MLCYRDMMFCSAPCAVVSCRRHRDQADGAVRTDLPVATRDFRPECKEFVQGRHFVTAEDAVILARSLERIGRWTISGKGNSLRALANACGDYLHYGPNDPRAPEIKL